MNTKFAFILILVGLFVVFIVQNVTVVEITFLFWSFQVSRVLLLFLALLIGLIIGWILHSIAVHRRSNQARD